MIRLDLCWLTVALRWGSGRREPPLTPIETAAQVADRARQADSRYVEEFEGRVDPNNRSYYWMTGRLQLLEEGEDVDVNVLEKGFASLTPIQYDMTAYNLLKKVEDLEL